MSIRTDIEDAVRDWIVLAGADGGVPDADSAVVMADQDAVRPALPYVTVRVSGYDQVVHTDEDLVDDSDPPVWQARGLRTGSVSLNAYGAEAEDWLERSVLMLRSPAVQALLDTAGLTIRPLGNLQNLSALLDDKTQVRFQRDFAIDYQRVATETDVEAVVELEQVVHVDEFRDDALDAGTPADRSTTYTEVL